MKQRKGRDKKDVLGRFVALPHTVLDSPSYRGLSVYAKALLVDVARQYMGTNNGSLLCSRRKMEEFGWKSSDTLDKAKKELLAANLLFQTVQGHRPNKASWYALTWLVLDKNEAYDSGAADTFRRGAYIVLTPRPTREETFAKWRKSEDKTQSLVRPADQRATG